jgi:hypothetical protein
LRYYDTYMTRQKSQGRFPAIAAKTISRPA